MNKFDGQYLFLAALILLVSIVSQSVTAQSFDGSDPKGPRCVSDCQCQFVSGSTGVCLCDADDGTDDDCPFIDRGGIDPRDPRDGGNQDGDDDDSGKSKGKSDSGKSKNSKKRVLKTSSKTKGKGKGGGDDDDDGGGPVDPRDPRDPRDPGGVDGLTFGAFCCDCECVIKPCACECFGYRNEDGGSIGDDDDTDDGSTGKAGKGKDGKNASGKSKSKKKARTRRRLSEVEMEDDSSHVRSRLSRGQDEVPEGAGWQSWIYNSVWNSEKEADPSDESRQLTKKKKKTNAPTNRPTNRPTMAPVARSMTSPPTTRARSPTSAPNDGGSTDCERPPYDCTYVKFYPGPATCESRKFCKANTFGYCDMNVSPR